MVDRHSPSDCIRHPLKETLPDQCQQLMRAYGDCKRGQIDMRKRFRGNKPIALSRELEGMGGEQDKSKVGTIEEKGYMLYAGRPKEGVEATKVDESKQEDQGTRGI